MHSLHDYKLGKFQYSIIKQIKWVLEGCICARASVGLRVLYVGSVSARRPTNVIDISLRLEATQGKAFKLNEPQFPQI